MTTILRRKRLEICEVRSPLMLEMLEFYTAILQGYEA